MLIEAMQKETYKITDGAMSDFNKAIRLDPKNENAHFFRGAAKSELKDYRGAIADHSKVIEINPKYADA
jgi:tetratricopeptide (TPR) repeat protein